MRIDSKLMFRAIGLSMAGAVGVEAGAASVQIDSGSVDITFRQSDNEGSIPPYDKEASFEVTGYGQGGGRLDFTYADADDDPDDDSDETVGEVTYDLQETGDGARLQVTSRVEKAFDQYFAEDPQYPEPAAFMIDSEFTVTFTTTQTMRYVLDVPVPDLRRYTGFEARFADQRAAAANDTGYPFSAAGFRQTGELDDRVLYDFLASGVLEAGTYTFFVAENGRDPNANYVGSGSATLTLSAVDTVIPTPAAAPLGLALLSLAALRRRRSSR